MSLEEGQDRTNKQIKQYFQCELVYMTVKRQAVNIQGLCAVLRVINYLLVMLLKKLPVLNI